MAFVLQMRSTFVSEEHSACGNHNRKMKNNILTTKARILQ